ncbi:MAG TPA: Hint domain-containing protein, partial [Acetobacteraceae bacterium]|nr:Hint domain-containing protein [Acetobacteraceae bacterium]
ELTHALGRTSHFGTSLTTSTVLDLFRYTSPGALATSASQTAYFSYDGGVTNANYFSASSDAGDWGTTASPDSFEAYIGTGQRYPMSTTDINTMNVLGFSTSSASCFTTGTRIATPAGEAPVERLRPGDPVRLADGSTAEVRWVGRQTIAARFVDPLLAWPIRIRAGALGPNLPRRDLLLSPGHAVLAGNVLAHAAALVNGSSIRRERRVPERFTYWHIELDTHALLLAEGAAVESYLDSCAEFAFDNAHERMPGSFPAEELPYPRCKSPRQLPRAVRDVLAVRATRLTDTREAA